MSTATLSVGRCNARYRVSPGSDDHRRLDDVLAVMLDEALEPALERAHAEISDAHVCIRRVEAPVRLALARHGERALASTWADAVAAAIAAHLRDGGPGVVRYGSRRHALLDMALCVAAGEWDREWAWRSLGLWPTGGCEPAHACVAALVGDGAAVAPVLARVARIGALPGLVARLAPSAFLELAAAALQSAGAPRELTVRGLAAAAAPATTPRSVRRALDRALERSEIAAALADTGAPLVAIAALALVETEPAAVAAFGERLVGALATRPAGAARAAPPRPLAAGLHPDDAAAPTTALKSATGDISHGCEPRDPHSPLPSDGSAEIGAPASGTPPNGTDAGELGAGEPLAVTSRAQGASAFGGLVFAVHAVVALDLASRFAALPGEVELRPALHALALALADGAEPGDAAALAFAGIAPGDEPPPHPGDEALAAIEVAAIDVHDWLAARLQCEASELDRAALLCRRAQIAADPGWIEFHLKLDEIDTAVRRAGLDLDPDHLPFLGCVMRIVYA